MEHPENEMEIAKVTNSDVWGYFTFKPLFYITLLLRNYLESNLEHEL